MPQKNFKKVILKQPTPSTQKPKNNKKHKKPKHISIVLPKNWVTLK